MVAYQNPLGWSSSCPQHGSLALGTKSASHLPHIPLASVTLALVSPRRGQERTQLSTGQTCTAEVGLQTNTIPRLWFLRVEEQIASGLLGWVPPEGLWANSGPQTAWNSLSSEPWV